MGYFPSGSQALKSLLAHVGTKKFVAADLLDWHILEQSKQVLYSPFQERIIFPISDHLGRACGFGGRIFKPQDERPKYYNSKENEFFTKGSLLFGFDQAKQKIHDTGTVFLVEGYTDCLAMVQAGYANTVATLGTACTLEHLKQLARHAHTLYVLYDGDSAGQKAMLRLADLAWEVNLEPLVITLPADQDPASILATQSLEPYVKRAQDIFMYYVDSLGAGFRRLPLGEKLRVAHRLLELIGKIESPLKRDLLLSRASEVLGVPFETLSNELSRTYTPADSPPASISGIVSDRQSESRPQTPKELWKQRVYELTQQIAQAERGQDYEQVRILLDEFENLKRGFREKEEKSN